MDLSTALLHDLLQLSSSVGLGEAELVSRLTALVSALRAAVPSYRGICLTVTETSQPVRLSAFLSAEESAVSTSSTAPSAF